MDRKEIEKYAVWKVNSEYIKITLNSIRNRIGGNEVLSIICDAEYGTLITQVNELCDYASTELEVTWLSERIVEMHKCILDDLSLLVDSSSLKSSHSWELSNRKIACERLRETYKRFRLRDEDTEALIEKCLIVLTSICDEINMGKEA